MSAHDDQREAIIARISRVAGAEAAALIEQHYAGQTLKVPPEDRVNASSKLVACVGLETAKLIAREFATTGFSVHVTVPLGSRSLFGSLARDIRSLKDEGLAPAEIAGRLGVHVRTVWRHLRNMKSREAGQ